MSKLKELCERVLECSEGVTYKSNDPEVSDTLLVANSSPKLARAALIMLEALREIEQSDSHWEHLAETALNKVEEIINE